MRRKKNNNEGITLVALVVTIVILLILAGITITYVFGDNGIIKLAQEAKNQTDEAMKKEQKDIGDLANWVEEKENTGKEKIIAILGQQMAVTDKERVVSIVNTNKDWKTESATFTWDECIIGEELVKMNGIKYYESYEYPYPAGGYIIDNNYQLYTWGDNSCGQLGVGNTEARTVPTKVEGMNNVEKVIGFKAYKIAKTRNGELYAWGQNNSGQLGIGNTTNQSKPVKIQGLDEVRDVYTDSDSVFALTENGDLYAWGDNGCGQIGIGDRTIYYQSEPTKIQGLEKIRKVYPVDDYVYALTENGDLYAWGHNAYGQLGTGDCLMYSAPVEVQGLEKVKEVYSYAGSVFAQLENGDLYAWGKNNYGQLGGGDRINRI